MGDENYLPLHPQLAPLELRVLLVTLVLETDPQNLILYTEF